MGAFGIERGESKSQSESELLKQTEIPHSQQACMKMLDELAQDNPSGNSLLKSIDPEITEDDLSKYLLKQPNELFSSNPDDPTHPESWVTGDMRPGLYGQKDNNATEVSEADEARIKNRPDYFEDLKTVFGDSQYFDLVRNHNGVITSPEGQKPGDKIDRDSENENSNDDTADDTTLINFDAHSDIWLDESIPKEDETIAQWVNAVLRDNPNINEVIWVVPDNFKSDPKLKEHYFNSGDSELKDQVMVHYDDQLDLYLDKETGRITTGDKPEDYSEDKYRTVKFQKKTIDELPDMEGKRLAVSIDLDYFANRGYDTALEASVPFTGEEGFAKFVETLKNKGIRPVHTTVSASPEYVDLENSRELLEFSSNIADATRSKIDAVAVPKQNNVYNMTGKHEGIQVDREGNKGLELFYDLFKLDSRTKNPDDALNLNGESQELNEGLELTRSIYGLNNTEEARDVLNRIDSMDGVDDGVLHFESIEMLLNRVCRNPDTSTTEKNPMRW